MNQPLHINQTKKIVFLFSSFSSIFFNILLFSSIGGAVIIKTIWGMIGISTVFFQIVELRNYYNTKRKIRYLHFTVYFICTLGSISGTIGAGYAQIEKSKPSIENIEIEKSKKAINKVLKNSKNLNQWAVIRLLKEKKQLENRTIKIKKTEKKISSSLNGIANIFNVSQELVAFIFLIFVSLVLELMVFGSVTFTGKLFNKSIKKGKKKIDKKQREIISGQKFFNFNKVA